MTSAPSTDRPAGPAGPSGSAGSAGPAGPSTTPELPASAVRLATRSVAVLAALAVGCVTLLLTVVMDPVLVAVVCLVLMVVLMLLGIAVGLAMFVSGCLGLLLVSGPQTAALTAGTLPLDFIASWSYSVIPSFILMGTVLWRSGIASDLFKVAEMAFGRLPGGLAVATNFAGAGMAASSGSTIGISFALTRMGVPEMLRRGYDRRMATGVVAMSGTLGQLIPPSILLVVYAGVAGTPVGEQLIAGLVPGFVLACLFSALIVVRVLLRPATAPRAEAGVRRFDPRVVAAAWPVPVLLVIVLGGMYSGVGTATEAAAAGALGAILVGALRNRGRNFVAELRAALFDTVSATAAIALLLAGAAVLNRMIVVSGAGNWMVDGVADLGLSRIGLLLSLMVLFLVLGMFMDPMGMMVLTVPLLLPLLVAAEIDLIWFGIFIVVLGEIAIVSPPVGVLTFVVHKAVQSPEVNQGVEVSLVDVFRGVLPFVGVALGLLVLMILWPGALVW